MALGTILVDSGLLNAEQLQAALDDQRATGDRLDHVVLRLGLVRPDDLLRALGQRLDVPVVDLATIAPDPATLSMLPAQLVFRHGCAPVERVLGAGGAVRALRVATSDPLDLGVFDEIRLAAGCAVEIALAREDDLRAFIRANYGVGGDTLDALSQGAAGNSSAAKDDSEEDEAERAQEASVVKLVNDLLIEAVANRATDVHIEPYEHELTVRYRVDGVLQRANVPPTINRFAAAIISRIKIMASLNIAEKRKPQDGRITLRTKGQVYDLRVSVIPMLFGEGVVLRILSKTAVLMSLNDLGMPQIILDSWDDLIERPHGILLVTGPTGSGKSTTLYASLQRIISDEVKAITVEDPVEYHVKGLNQIQVNHKVGLDFAAGLRSILRHDPDVILIGEIRDRETAEAAVQASLTGHLVFSTLHTNDAASALPRLLDMGIEPYLVASSIEGVLAQRLVRRVCPECAAPYTPEHSEVPSDFQLPDSGQLMHGTGCRACLNTGYRGRIGIYELLRITEEARELVMKRANAMSIASEALRTGHLTLLRQDGFEKVRAGLTTLAEVMRATKA